MGGRHHLPAHGPFLYLIAIMDWHSRYLVAWRLSNTMETGFCAEALGDALKQGTPEVFNTDQGSQFTSREFRQILQDHRVKISMDGHPKSPSLGAGTGTTSSWNGCGGR